MSYSPATKPTFYFIGVTTGSSSIMRVFPEWAKYLGLGDVQIKGIDLVPHDTPERYRAVVEFIKNDPLSLGALVTTHKLDLYAAARDMFDVIDPHARLMAETSCLSKRNGKLICHAKDPISSGLALDGFLPHEHFARTGAEVFSMGAGGSTIALTWHLMQKARGANRPSRIIVSNRSPARLDHIREIHEIRENPLPLCFHAFRGRKYLQTYLRTYHPYFRFQNGTPDIRRFRSYKLCDKNLPKTDCLMYLCQTDQPMLPDQMPHGQTDRTSFSSPGRSVPYTPPSLL